MITRRRSPAQLSHPDLHMYRGATVGLLRRYFCMAIEAGRLPALLGRECFRSRTDARRPHTFEDAVIFVHDVERCLELLDDTDQKLIAYLVFQQYTEEEVARLLRCTDRTIRNRFPNALDLLSATFLERRLMTPYVLHRAKSCQDLENDEIVATLCSHGE